MQVPAFSFPWEKRRRIAAVTSFPRNDVSCHSEEGGTPEKSLPCVRVIPPAGEMSAKRTKGGRARVAKSMILPEGLFKNVTIPQSPAVTAPFTQGSLYAGYSPIIK